MAIKEGMITARPTKYGAKTDSYWLEGVDDFINGTGPIETSGKNSYTVMLYGFDFRALAKLKNVQITGVTIAFTVQENSAYNTSISFRGISDFNSTGSVTSAYTDLGDGSIKVVDNVATLPLQTINVTGDKIPNTLSWIKSNLSKVIEGYENTTFGIRYYSSCAKLNDLTITLYYTHEVTEVTVTADVLPAGAGTVSPATQQVEVDATATVTATPATGYKFSHWLLDGADSGITAPTLTRTVTSNLLCTAVFIIDKINKILCDTSQLKKILIDTQEVKEVYIDKTKVFG